MRKDVKMCFWWVGGVIEWTARRWFFFLKKKIKEATKTNQNVPIKPMTTTTQ